MISAIVARSRNGIIGKNNDLPWHLPDDLKNFSQLTRGHTVIMGRKTAESIFTRLGYGLPRRRNILISRDAEYVLKGFIVANTFEDALFLAHDGDVFVIGGAQIYEQAMPFCERLYITEIDADVDGDVYFPELATTQWHEISRKHHLKDDTNEYDFDFVVYERTS